MVSANQRAGNLQTVISRGKYIALYGCLYMWGVRKVCQGENIPRAWSNSIKSKLIGIHSVTRLLVARLIESTD